ncbi:hypothetical protein T492DRAFT_1073203, partial [Pavlovales sp. CCMP2436]
MLPSSMQPSPGPEETTPELPSHYVEPEAPASTASSRLRLGGKGPLRLAAASRKVAFGSVFHASPRSVFSTVLPAAPAPPSIVGSPSLAARPILLPHATGDAPQFAAHSHVLKQFLHAPKPAPTPKPTPASTSDARSAALVEKLTKPSRNRRKVAVTLRWPSGGSSVFLLGSFTNWTERVPMIAESDGLAFFATINLPAGDHYYLFEVKGMLCVADAEKLASVPLGSAPSSIVNTVLVDDGAEFEEFEEYIGTTPPKQVGEFKAASNAPPALPPHLAKLHGVQLAAPHRAPRPAELQHAVFADSELNHAAFARCGVAARLGIEDDIGDSSTSPEHTLEQFALPEMMRPYALAPAATVSITSRWRTHRVTHVLIKPMLIKPTQRSTAPLSEITSRRTTVDSAGAVVDNPKPRSLLCAAPVPYVPKLRPLPFSQSDVSMGSADDDSPPSSPTMQFEPMDDVPTHSPTFSFMASGF